MEIKQDNGLKKPILSCIVAMGADNSIGLNGDMPWHLSEDLKHFKAVTTGHPVIMGRKTWESLPKKPLPGRRNIVVTRNASYDAPGAETAGSLSDALDLLAPDDSPFLIGGGSLYSQAIQMCGRLVVTHINTLVPSADTFFPAIDPAMWRISRLEGPFVSKSGLTFSFAEYERIADQ